MWRKFKNKFIGTGDFYRYVLYLAVPMIVQNAITSFVSFLDNIMVGQIGTEQMSGVAIVNQLMFVFNICIFGGVSGAGIFGTQFYGKEYLAIMMIGLIPFALGQAYTSTIRETGQTLVPMIAGIAAVATNLFLDYILIFGIGGMPGMGVRGAAIATVIARFIECFIVVFWTHTHKEVNPYIKGAYSSPKIPRSVLRGILIKGSPLMLNEMFWASGMAVISQCYAVRGLEVVAAQNISSTISNLFNIVYLQLGGCISIVVGQLLGAGKIEDARDADNKMIFFSVFCCACISAVMVVVGRYFPSIYNTEETIKALAQKLIVISALVMPLCSFSHAAYFTLRSGGKTIVTFLFDSVFVWVLVIPFAYTLANYTNLTITTVFFLVQFTEIIKVILGLFMLKSGVWLQNIVEEKA